MNRILVVEDEKPILNLIRMNLLDAGYGCVCAENGLEAADILEQETFDLAILDIMLPGLNGYELLEYMRPMQIPVIFLTGHGDVDMAVQAMKDGAIDFIQKPINEERLLSAVAKAVRYDESHRGWTISAEEEKKRYQTLTAREKQILSLIAKGLINKEVSERLGLSPRTIEVHRQKGLHKLGVQTVSELVRLLSHIEENALS